MKDSISFDYLKERINSLETDNSELRHQNSELRAKISELSHIKEKNRNCEDRLKAIDEDAPLAIVYTDEEGRITTCNKRAEILFGASKEKLIGFSHKDISDQNMKKAIIKALSGKKSSFEGEHLTASGNKKTNMFANFSPLFHPDGRVSGIIGLFEDISERIHMEKERDQLISELKSALSKIRTLSGFIPICASCKKIRDDKGFWTQVEEYVHEHYDAEFSHGVCPDCMKKLYPGESVT